jgi:hypothetical protein
LATEKESVSVWQSERGSQLELATELELLKASALALAWVRGPEPRKRLHWTGCFRRH